jgi:hypothetical protein
MFVEVVPVNAITIADNLIATQFGLRGISEAREVFEGTAISRPSTSCTRSMKSSKDTLVAEALKSIEAPPK